VDVVADSGGNVKWFVGAVLVPIVVACIGAGVAVSQGACLPLICSDKGPGPSQFPTGFPSSVETEIFLSKLSGPAGTQVNVSGKGFGPNESVIIRFHVREIGRTTANGDGEFTAAVTVPSMVGPKPQPFAINATGNSSVRHAEAQFTLTG
jgi:hypothetical protein